MTTAIATLISTPTGQKYQITVNGEIVTTIGANSLPMYRSNVKRGKLSYMADRGVTSVEIGHVELQGTSSAAYTSEIATTSAEFELSIADRMLAVSQVPIRLHLGSSYVGVVCGSAGVGKSTRVMASISALGYEIINNAAEIMEPGSADVEPIIDTRSNIACVVSGAVTERGLFNMLRCFPNAMFVFDDVDDCLKNGRVANMLMAATDTRDSARVISWGNKNGESFTFEGTILFITNKQPVDFHSAIRSRAGNCLANIVLSKMEMLELMEEMICDPAFLPTVDIEFKNAAIDMVRKYMFNPAFPPLTLRHLRSTAMDLANAALIDVYSGASACAARQERLIAYSWLQNR